MHGKIAIDFDRLVFCLAAFRCYAGTVCIPLRRCMFIKKTIDIRHIKSIHCVVGDKFVCECGCLFEIYIILALAVMGLFLIWIQECKTFNNIKRTSMNTKIQVSTTKRAKNICEMPSMNAWMLLLSNQGISWYPFHHVRCME